MRFYLQNMIEIYYFLLGQFQKDLKTCHKLQYTQYILDYDLKTGE